MEIAYVPLEQARRGNRAQVEAWLATFTRLFAELAAFGRRLAAAGGKHSPKSPSPDHLRNRLERRFAPGLDGFQALEELREAKLALENELTTDQVQLREAIEDTQRRRRKLREDIQQSVEVVVNADLSLVQTAMVRFAESGESTEQQRLRDKEKEESWCQDHTRMRERLAQHGLGATLKMHLQPGEHPVRVVQRHPYRPATRPHAERKDLRQKRL